MLGGCGGLFYAWWMFWASESAKATLEETTAPVVALLLSAVSWVKDCVQALVARITGAIPAQALPCTRMTRHIGIANSRAPLACLLDSLLWLKQSWLVGNLNALLFPFAMQAGSGVRMLQRRSSSRWHPGTLGWMVTKRSSARHRLYCGSRVGWVSLAGVRAGSGRVYPAGVCLVLSFCAWCCR